MWPYLSGGLPSGESLTVLLGFRNNGESPMNVSHIVGSVNSPQQFSMYVVNFTTAEYKTIVVGPSRYCSPRRPTRFSNLVSRVKSHSCTWRVMYARHYIMEPSKEASFEYRFSLDPQLAGHDFTLAFTAFYQAGQGPSTFPETLSIPLIPFNSPFNPLTSPLPIPPSTR